MQAAGGPAGFADRDAGSDAGRGAGCPGVVEPMAVARCGAGPVDGWVHFGCVSVACAALAAHAGRRRWLLTFRFEMPGPSCRADEGPGGERCAAAGAGHAGAACVAGPGGLQRLRLRAGRASEPSVGGSGAGRVRPSGMLAVRCARW